MEAFRPTCSPLEGHSGTAGVAAVPHRHYIERMFDIQRRSDMRALPWMSGSIEVRHLAGTRERPGPSRTGPSHDKVVSQETSPAECLLAGFPFHAVPSGA